MSSNRPSSRARGVMTIVLSLIGMAFALVLGITLLLIRPNLVTQSKSMVGSVSQTLTTTQSGLSLIQGSLDEVETSSEKLEESLDTLNTSVRNLSPLVSDVSELVGTDMVNIATDGQTTLESAAESSKLIDSTLELLAKIPLLRLDYVPDVPLHTTLKNVAGNFATLPEVLTSIKTNLDQTSVDVQSLGSDIAALSVQMGVIKTSLGDARPIFESYQETLTGIQASTAEAELSLPHWINSITIGLVVLFAWAFLSQLMRFLEGLDYLKSGTIPSEPALKSSDPGSASESQHSIKGDL